MRRLTLHPPVDIAQSTGVLLRAVEKFAVIERTVQRSHIHSRLPPQLLGLGVASAMKLQVQRCGIRAPPIALVVENGRFDGHARVIETFETYRRADNTGAARLYRSRQ